MQPTSAPGPTPSPTVSLSTLAQRFWDAIPFPSIQAAPSQPITPSPIPASQNLLSRIHRVTFRSLALLPHSQREATRQQLAQEVLKRRPDWATAVGDWSLFAAILCAGITRHTSWGGVDQEEATVAALHFLDFCLQPRSGVFLETRIPESIVLAMKHALSLYQACLPFRLPLQDTPHADHTVRKKAAELLVHIKETLNKEKTLYLPMGYRHGNLNQGHALVWKITEQSDSVMVQILNLGNGSEFHPVLNYSLNQQKRSYAFFPVQIAKKVFYGEAGQTAFCHLLRYLSDAPSPGDAYDGQDLNNLLLQLGERVILNLGPHQQELDTQDQLGPNCAQMSITYIMEDVMIAHRIPQKERRKLFLNRDFCVLLGGYHAWIQDPGTHPAAWQLLCEGAQSVGANLLDLYAQKELAEGELLAVQAVIHKITQTARQSPSFTQRSIQVSKPTSPISDHFPPLPSLNQPTSVDAPPIPYLHVTIPVPQFHLNTLSQDLKTWIDTALKLPQEDAFDFVVDCVRTLPIPIRAMLPSKKQEPDLVVRNTIAPLRLDAWDAIPLSAITELVTDLSHLLDIGLYEIKVANDLSSSLNFAQQFLLIYTLYAIIDKLARRSEDNRLSGYASPFLPYPFSWIPGEFSSLPFGEDNRRYSAILTYFTGQEHLTDPKDPSPPIFPIAPLLPVSLFIEDHFSQHVEKARIQGRNHIAYLAQFIPNTVQKKNSEEPFLQAWCTLPPQVQALYNAVFMAHALFFLEDKPFPQKLTFSRTQIGDRPGLKIDGLWNPQKDQFEPERPHFHSRFFSSHGEPTLKQPIYDERFEQQGVRLDSEHPLLFSPELRALTTNDAICYPLSESQKRDWKLTEADFRTLLYILRKPNLSVWQAITVFSLPEHRLLLSHPAVQQALDAALFHPRFLPERLASEPASLTATFRQWIQETLDQFSDNHFQIAAVFFLLRLGMCFETFTADENRNPTLDFYRETIQQWLARPLTTPQKEGFVLYQLLIDTHHPTADPAVLFPRLFQLIVSGAHVSDEATWLLSHLNQMMRTNAYRFKEALEDSALRSPLCASIVSHLIPHPEFLATLPKEGWQGSFPQYQCGPLVLNFWKGTLFHTAHQGVLHQFSPSLYHAIPREYRGLLQNQGNLYWEDKDHNFTSLNGKLKSQKGQWSQSIPTTEGELAQCPVHLFYSEESDAANQGFLSWYSYLPWVHFREKPGVIITYDQKAQTPYLRMEYSAHRVTYTCLDEKGRSLPYRIANLSKLQPGDLLYAYTVRFTHPDQVICFVHEEAFTSGTCAPHHIRDLNFYRANLQFVRDEKGLASVQYPGFYLIARKEDLPPSSQQNYVIMETAISSFRFAFPLYHPESKVWRVIIPQSLSLRQTHHVFSTEVENTGHGFLSYYLYEIDLVEKTLKSLDADPDATYSMLAFIFKVQGDYQKAYAYLYRLKTSHQFRGELFSKFISLRDSSMTSTVFNLRLVLFVLRSGELMLESRFASKKHYEHLCSLIHWAIRNYHDYLKLITDTGLSRVPENMVLSDGEKKMLLMGFRAYYQETYQHDPEGWEERWKQDQPLLDAQYHVYFLPKRENRVFPRPQKIPLHPSVFQQVKTPDKLSYYLSQSIPSAPFPPLPAYPIQTTEKAVAAHFSSLYNQARACPPRELHPFDFTLHALLKTQADYRLGNLLFWVRHFPNYFAGKEWDISDTTAHHPSTFSPFLARLVARIRQIEKDPYYPQFLKTVLKREESFRVHEKEGIFLSAPRSKEPSIPLSLSSGEKKPADLQGLETEIRKIFDAPYTIRQGALEPADIEEETCFLLKQDSSLTLTAESFDLLPELLMKQAILKGNLTFILKHRPMLTPKDAERLCWLVNEWYHARVLIKHQKEGTSDRYLPYDHQRYPEISYFYLLTGKFPRESQLQTYLWICEGISQKRNRYFQLPTGEGKTDVVVPLLNLAAKKWGKMAVTCVTSAIYPVDKENLHFNLRLLNEHLGYLEIGVHMINTLTGENLKFIYLQLKQYQSEGRSLLITRHTYDALFLTHELACYISAEDPKQEPSVQAERGMKILWSQRILDFFAKECVLLCDEGHQNGDPRTRAIYGVGNFCPLPKEESAYLLEMMRPLLDVYPEKAVSPIVRLNKDLDAIPSPQEVDTLRSALAEAYLNRHFSEISANDKPSFLAYWTREDAPQPSLVSQWAKSTTPQENQRANFASMTSHFLLVLLPDILKMRTDIDHSRSLYPQRKHDVPAQNKLPSTAEYDDRYKTAALTIKGAYHRGLSLDDLRQLLIKMIHSHTDEQRHGVSARLTPSNRKFQGWIHPTDPSSLLHGIDLDTIDLNREPLMHALWENLHHHYDVIELFLHNHGFEGIGMPEQQLTCTTTDVFNGFSSAILFSATPLDERANPRCFAPEDYQRDPLFLSKVRDTLRHPRNQKIITVPTKDRFFERMHREHADLWSQATVLIDPRGFLSASSNAELAKEWMALSPGLDGVLFWGEERTTSVDRHEKICFLDKKGTLLTLDGSQIKQSLKEHRLDWETLRIGTLYDPTHTESANISQKPDATALFFLCEGLTTSHAIQAMTRLRGFLTQEQRIVMVYEKKLAQKIFSSSDPTADFLHWTDQNEQQQTEKQIVINAFQEIQFAIAKAARQEIAQAHASDTTPGMLSVFKLYKRYQDGFVETLPTSAYAAFGHHEVLENTEVVLQRFAQTLYARFRYALPYANNQPVKAEIQAIIASAKTSLPKIHAHQNRGKQIEQQTHLRTRMERAQENQCPRPIEPFSLDGRYGNLKIYDPTFFSNERILASTILRSPFLTERFYFTENQMRTGRLRDASEEDCQILKPIHFFMILVTQNPDGNYSWKALAESHEILATQLDDLMTCPDHVQGLKHSVFIVTAQGHLVQKGLKALAPPPALVETLLKSEWLQDLLIDAALLQGRISNPERLLARIRKTGWRPFHELWSAILHRLPNLETAHLDAFAALKDQL